ncbi:MAG: hypothetical protein K9H16_03680 [Bacteroidales bacterium]|nr:hypothetical protein [Bacteroidales bacterium]
MTNKYFIICCRPLFCYLIILFLSLNTNAQINQELSDLKEYALQQYGTSNFLVNGWKYFPDHFNAKGNPYFDDQDWTSGSLVNSGGETFRNLNLRYNLEMDELVLSQVLKNGIPVFVLLNKDFVVSFTLGSHKFVKAESIPSDPQLKGYVEEIFSGKINFYVKHQKNFVGNYNANTPDGSISKQITTRYLLTGNRLIRVQSKNAFLKAFQAYRKEIKKFMATTKINYKKATNSQLIELMKFCNER